MTQTMISLNPATYEVLGLVPLTSQEEIVVKVIKAKQVQPDWQVLGLKGRLKALRELWSALDKNKQVLSEMTAREMGRLVGSCEKLTASSLDKFKWDLDNAPEHLKNEVTYEDNQTINEVIYEPRGVIACVMAWNFPVSNFVFSVVQALIAGNAVIVKYSEEIPLFSKLIEEVCASANLPEGVLSFVHGNGKTGALLTDQDIDMILFTGSSAVGQELYAKAAAKGIPILMELGGSSPGIVFQDADIKTILPLIYGERFLNCGQSCSNLKRLIVHSSVFQPCVDGLAEIASRIKIGDPLLRNTEMGPLVAERQVIKLEEQVEDAVTKGAKIVHGGKRFGNMKGAWYEPTILTGVTKDMRVWTEEVFGPVLPVVSFDTYEEAIALANDTDYGLTAYIYTPNKTLALNAAKDIKAGSISINGQSIWGSFNPFGGYKRSGIGRENGKWGFHEVCQVKMIARNK